MNTTQARVVAAAVVMVAGVVVAILGYLGVSRELEVAFQLPYLASAGVGAIMLVGTGAALLVSAQLQRDTDRLDELEEAVRLLAAEIGHLVDQRDPLDGDREALAR